MKKKTNFLFYIAVFLLIVSGGLYGYLYISLEENKSAIGDMYSSIQADRSVLSYLEKIDSEFPKIKAQGDYLDRVLVKNSDAVVFIQSLEDIMQKGGVTGSVDTVSEVDTNKNNLSLTLKMSGEWNKLVTTVGLLERIPYTSTIQSMHLVFGDDSKFKKNSTSTQKTWNATVSLNVMTTE